MKITKCTISNVETDYTIEKAALVHITVAILNEGKRIVKDCTFYPCQSGVEMGKVDRFLEYTGAKKVSGLITEKMTVVLDEQEKIIAFGDSDGEKFFLLEGETLTEYETNQFK